MSRSLWGGSVNQGRSQAVCNLSVLAGVALSSSAWVAHCSIIHQADDWLWQDADPGGVCACVCVSWERGTHYKTRGREEVSGACVEIAKMFSQHSDSECMTASVFISLYKLHFIFCVWPLIQRSDFGCASHPPGCVLQSAADLTHLLLPKIHHRQMDPAVLAHTHFPRRIQNRQRKGCYGWRRLLATAAFRCFPLDFFEFLVLFVGWCAISWHLQTKGLIVR